jgi:hypothetical protein
MTIRSQFADVFIMGRDVMTSAIAKTGAIVVQLGDVASSLVDRGHAEWWQHTGFASRPRALATPGDRHRVQHAYARCARWRERTAHGPDALPRPPSPARS